MHKDLDITNILYSMQEGTFWTDAWAQSWAEVQRAELAGLVPAIKRIVIVGCGTSNYAGFYGKDMMEAYTGIPTSVVDGNTGRYLDAKLYTSDTLFIGISNTGNSGTAVESIDRAAKGGARTLSITGNPDSRIAAVSDAILFFPGAVDKVATKTRSYIETMIMLLALAVRMGQILGCADVPTADTVEDEMVRCGQAAGKVFHLYDGMMAELAADYKAKEGFHIVGAGLNLGNAMEAGLKLCEIGWVNSEGMELESFMHGKFRGAGPQTPFFVMAHDDQTFKTAVNFVAVAKQVGAECITITDRDFVPLKELSHRMMLIDSVWEVLCPMLFILPVYMFAVYLGIERGHENPAVSQFGRPAQTIQFETLYPDYEAYASDV